MSTLSGFLSAASPYLTATSNAVGAYQGAQSAAEREAFSRVLAERRAQHDEEEQRIHAQLAQGTLQNMSNTARWHDEENDRQTQRDNRNFMLGGGVPAHTEPGQPVGQLAETPNNARPSFLSLHQPGEAGGPSTDTEIPNIAGRLLSKQAPVTMKTPDVKVPDEYDPNGDRAYIRNQQSIDGRSVAADLARESREREAEASRALRERIAANSNATRVQVAGMPSRSSGVNGVDTPQSAGSHKDLKDTQGQQIRAEHAVQALKSDEKALLTHHSSANLPLSESFTAADSAAARQYQATDKELRGAEAVRARLGQRADSILNVIPQQRNAALKAPAAPSAPVGDPTDDELDAAIAAGKTKPDDVRAFVASLRKKPRR